MLSRPIRTTASDSLRLLHPLVVNRLFSKKTYKILRDLTSQETYSFDEPFLEDKILFIEAINNTLGDSKDVIPVIEKVTSAVVSVFNTFGIFKK